MTWKGKDKDLTREEAIALAQQELAPFWIGSTPLLRVHGEESQAELFPLDPSITQETWVMLFLDPLSFSGESALTYIKELKRRYQAHHVGFLIFYYSPYWFIHIKRHFKKWVELHNLPCPIVFDHKGAYCRAFQFTRNPRAFIYHQGQRVFETSGMSWLKELEAQLQIHLRKTDPGLAFLPLILPQEDVSEDVARIELGFSHEGSENAGLYAQFHGVEFQELDPMTRKSIPRSELPEKIDLQQVLLQGNWGQDWERIWTDDPSASLQFESGAAAVALVVQPLAGEPRDTCRIEVDLNGGRVYADVMGSSLVFSELGDASLSFSAPGMFQILKKLPEQDRRVTLRFPDAARAPVALYGIRFGMP